MSNAARLFIAIPLDDVSRSAIEKVASVCRPYFEKARWVPSQNYHLTLKFLGNTERDRIEAIDKTLTQVTAAYQPFTLQFSGSGVFPGWRRPRVFWVGIQPHPVLEDLAAAVDTAMQTLGFAPESRTFSPHLTLARIRYANPSVLARFRERHAPLLKEPVTTCSADTVILFESQLRRDGARYTAVHSYPLQ